MIAVTRVACVLTIVVMLAAMGTLAAPPASEASPSAPAVARTASINLGGIFGSENEPDENEPDENDSENGQPAAPQVHHSSGLPLPVVALIVVLGLIAAGFVVIRVRRFVRRVRELRARLGAWGRDLTRTRR